DDTPARSAVCGTGVPPAASRPTPRRTPRPPKASLPMSTPDEDRPVPPQAPPVVPAPPASPAPPVQWGMASLRATGGAGVRWLWRGYLAAGAVTLLTSQWKTGKTTLTAVLLARLKAGGQLAGLPLA